MAEITELLFTPLALKSITLPNRLVRSATYEGLADTDGRPLAQLTELYRNLTRHTPLTIITGFCAVSRQGRAIHPSQGAIWDDSLIAPWEALVASVKQHSPATRLLMQLAHTGRQTLSAVTGQKVVGASAKRCTYFRQRVRPLTEPEIIEIIGQFAAAARRAQQAGFDGVQLHAAHGYLLHQFLSSRTNTRNDRWREADLLLHETVLAVRRRCGANFPIWLKVSHADDYGLRPINVIAALKPLETELDAVEVSYGTMEHALNIFRGGCPLDTVFKINPIYRRVPAILKFLWKHIVFPLQHRAHKPFKPLYNLEGALALQNALQVPIIPVGGIHTARNMEICRQYGFPAVALCRPFICEPDLARKLHQNQWCTSACTRCNLCAIYCDSTNQLHCYRQGGQHD